LVGDLETSKRASTATVPTFISSAGANDQLTLKGLSNLLYQDYWLFFVPRNSLYPCMNRSLLNINLKTGRREEARIFEQA
jgi:hypothetical protein